MKTQELRKLCRTLLLETPGETYYRTAPADAVFPYKTFDLSRVGLQDLHRDDFELTVDILDRSPDPKDVDEIADRLEALLNDANLPQETILPTFFRESRFPVPDQEPGIQRTRLTFQVQLYLNE